MSKSAVNLLKEQIKSAHQAMEGTLADVTNEDAHAKPGGLANPIGAQYAHVLVSEDGIISGLSQSEAPLFASQFAGKAGFNSFPPRPNDDSPGLPNWHEWADSVEVDMDALREYAQAVYAATESYLNGISDADLEQMVPTAVGEMPVSSLLTGAVVGNFYMHCGEVAALKGTKGKQGYPF